MTDTTVTSSYNTFGVKVTPTSTVQAAGLSTLASIVDNSTNPGNIASGNMVSEVGLVDGFLQSSNFETGVQGWQISSTGDVEFNSGTFRGNLQANSIDIPNETDPNSFHVDNMGNTWWGATTFAAAPASIDNTGAAIFNSATIAGYVVGSKGAFGGDGSDGALSLTSGTTNFDLAGAAVYVKNYSSISVTGTAAITFTNPNSNGSIVVFKSQGNVTITSSATRAFDLRQMGGGVTNNIARTVSGGNGGTGNGGTPGTVGASLISVIAAVKDVFLATGGNGGSGGACQTSGNQSGGGGSGGSSLLSSGTTGIAGAGNGDGSNTSGGVGGRGGGCLYIESRGSWNVSGTFDVSGQNGVASVTAAGGGAGGAGGGIVSRYNSITSDTATYTVSGGTGGGAGAFGGAGGNGGAGYANIALNTEFA